MEKSRKNLLLLTIAVICQFIIAFGVVLFNQNLLMNFPLGARMVYMLISQWLFLIVPIIFMIRGKETAGSIGFTAVKIPLQIFIGVMLGIAMCLIFTIVPILLGYKDMVSSTRYTEIWQFAYQFLYSIFAVALVEEIFFRGYLFKKLLDIKNTKWFAIIISSIIFGLFHIFQGNIIQLFVASILGILFCLFREKIKNCSLLSLIIAHGIYDALIILCVSLM